MRFQTGDTAEKKSCENYKSAACAQSALIVDVVQQKRVKAAQTSGALCGLGAEAVNARAQRFDNANSPTTVGYICDAAKRSVRHHCDDAICCSDQEVTLNTL